MHPNNRRHYGRSAHGRQLAEVGGSGARHGRAGAGRTRLSHIAFDAHGDVVEYAAKLGERLADVRLAAAVQLAPRVEIAEALMLGVGVPARRLDPAWTRALTLEGDVVLDGQLAVRVIAQGPLLPPSWTRQ